MDSKFTVYDSRGELDLRQIANSGQCFRLKEYATDKFIAVTGSHAVDIHRRGDVYIFWCDAKEFQAVWAPYFDLDTDYKGFKSKMQDDPFLKDALKTGGGIRILRQDLWEMAVTFTISQRNNIPRIAQSVEALCENFGTPLQEIGGRQVYAFPTADQLLWSDLSVASLGYREPYIKGLCGQGDAVWQSLPNLDDMLRPMQMYTSSSEPREPRWSTMFLSSLALMVPTSTPGTRLHKGKPFALMVRCWSSLRMRGVLTRIHGFGAGGNA